MKSKKASKKAPKKALILLFLGIFTTGSATAWGHGPRQPLAKFGHFPHAEFKQRALAKVPERLRPLTQAEALERAKQVGEISYDLSLILTKTKRFSGTAEIEFTLSADADLAKQALFLDFISVAEVTALTINGKAVEDPKALHRADRIELPAARLLTGAKNAVTINYNAPYRSDGFGLTRVAERGKNGEIYHYVYSQFEVYEANRVFPVFDQPDLKAIFTLSVRAPREWEVITATPRSNEKIQGAEKVWDFLPSAEPITTYAFSIHAGDYALWKDERHFTGKTTLRLFARRSIQAHVDRIADRFFRAQRLSLEFFEKKFGIPYAFGKLDSVFIPEFAFGAMENIGAVTYVEDLLLTEPYVLPMVIAHETAHMWFGNFVTMKWWDDIWLNESFAEFLAFWALEDMESELGLSGAWEKFERSGKTSAYQADAAATADRHPVWSAVADTNEAEGVFDSITYSKGAAILRQLMFQIGGGQFELAIGNYLSAFQWQNVTRADFLDIWSGSLRMANFSRWAESWFGSEGFNQVEARFTCDSTSGTLEELWLHQSVKTGDDLLRKHKTQLALFQYNRILHKLEPLVTIDADYESRSTQVTLPSPLPCPDLVHPNFRGHDYVWVNLDAKSKKTLREVFGSRALFNSSSDSGAGMFLSFSLDSQRESSSP